MHAFLNHSRTAQTHLYLCVLHCWIVQWNDGDHLQEAPIDPRWHKSDKSNHRCPQARCQHPCERWPSRHGPGHLGSGNHYTTRGNSQTPLYYYWLPLLLVLKTLFLQIHNGHGRRNYRFVFAHFSFPLLLSKNIEFGASHCKRHWYKCKRLTFPHVGPIKNLYFFSIPWPIFAILTIQFVYWLINSKISKLVILNFYRFWVISAIDQTYVSNSLDFYRIKMDQYSCRDFERFKYIYNQ